MTVPSGAIALLHDRNYVLLFIARTLAMLSFAFAPVALAFGILDMPGGTAVILSVVLAFQLGPNVVLVLFGGVVADRYSRSRLIAAGESVVGVGWAAIGVLLLQPEPSVWLMCVCAAATGIGGSLVYPALTGIIPDLVAEENLTEANAYLQGANATARLIGVVAGGVTVALLGGGLALLIAGALYLISGAMCLFLPKTSRTAGTTEPMLSQLRQGWGEFSSHQWLWVVVLTWGLMYMFFEASVGVLGPHIGKLDLGGAGGWTWVLAGEAVGAIAAVVVSMFWRPRHPIFVGALLAVFCGVPGLLLGYRFPLWIIVVAAVGMGFGLQLFGVYWLTTMQLEVPPESLSRVASYDAFGSILLGPLGLVLAGPADELFGPHLSIIVCSVICIVVVGLALLSPDVRHIAPYRKHEGLADAPLSVQH
ncbi:MAG: MFS transporter [Propionibacteriaceae bacterium]|jgi:MFS family permease|nr:MFS transporter [Propionibacteriaceae bacterium]